MNTATELLHEITVAGCQARVEGGMLRLNGPRPLSSELMEQLRAHKPEILALLSAEEARIREWLAGISETDPDMVKDTLDRCRTDSDTRRYFLERADEVPPPLTADDLVNIAEAIEERAAIQEFDGKLTGDEAESQGKAAMQVYRYRLTDNPAHWLAMIAPGCDLKEAIRSVEGMFGQERVLEVRRHQL